MASVEALQIQFQDGISAGAQAASASMDRLASSIDKASAAAEQQDSKIQRAGQSFASVQKLIDGNATATSRADSANAAYAGRVATVTAAMTAQGASAAQIGVAIARLGAVRDADIAKATSQGQAIEQKFGPATAATKALSGATDDAAAATSRFGVESGRSSLLLHDATKAVTELANGMPPLMVAFQHVSQAQYIFGSLGGAIKAAGGFLLSLPGAAVVATAGLAALTVEAERADRALDSMAARLTLTQSNAHAAALSVQSAFHAAASQTPGLSSTDAKAAGLTIAAAPDFSGTSSQLKDMITESNSLARALGETVPNAAKELADAMSAPSDAAQKFADQGFRGFDQAFADHIKLLDEAGDRTKAFDEVNAQLKADLPGSETFTPLEKAIAALGHAIDDADASGKTFAHTLGEGLATAASVAVKGIADAVQWLDKLDNETHGLFWKATGIPSPYGSPTPTGNVNLGTPVTHMVHGQSITEQAQGLFQVLPSTGADFGASTADLGTLAGNTAAGMSYLQLLLKRSGGDWGSALATYSHTSGASAKAYLDSVANQDVTKLPADARSAIEQQAGVMQDLPPEFLGMSERIAMQESSGHQFRSGPPVVVQPPSQPIDVSGGTSNRDVQDLLDQAQKKSSDTPAAGAKEAAAEVDLFTHALAALGQQGETSGSRVEQFTEELQKQKLALQNAVPALQAQNTTLDLQTAATGRLADAYTKGYAAVAHATAINQASQDALSIASRTTTAYAAAVEDLTPKIEALNAEQAKQGFAKQANDNQTQITYLQAETAALGMNDQARVAYLAHLQAEQELQKANIDVTSDAAQEYLKSVDAITAATYAYDQQKQSLDELADDFKTAFDSVGNSISQAFVSGQGHAVDFGNVARGVVGNLATQFVKLSVINPIENSVLGSSSPTLSSIVSAVGALGSGSGLGSTGGALGAAGGIAAAGAGGIGGALGPISSIVSLAKGIFGGSGSSTGGLLFGSDSFLSGILSTPLIGGGGALVQGQGYAAVLASQAAATPALTVGSLLGGIGAGSALGGIEDYLFGAKNPTSQELGMGGSLAGSAAGALIGSIVPGLGTLFGGPIGGLRGGTLFAANNHRKAA